MMARWWRDSLIVSNYGVLRDSTLHSSRFKSQFSTFRGSIIEFSTFRNSILHILSIKSQFSEIPLSTRWHVHWHWHALKFFFPVEKHCGMLQCTLVRGSVLQCAIECCSVWQCVAVCCSMLKRASVCCNMLQWQSLFNIGKPYCPSSGDLYTYI